MNYYLGIDIGSTTCKLVMIDENEEIINKQIIPIMSQPLETLKEAFDNFDYKRWNICNIGVTGSSRTLVAKYLKTDVVKSEIIAHTYATMKYVENVGTIFEIGGQDSKYISIDDGIISDYKMNSVCAAGTGSFLQWQAEKMGLDMEKFDMFALDSNKRINVNGRCTVFIESALVNLKRMGESKEDIAHAICLCLAHNYISEMCKTENLKEPIVFQGGVARLKAMKKAFEEVLDKRIIVNENCQYMGAIGVAMLAAKEKSVIGEINLSMNNLDNYEKRLLKCHDCQRECDIVEYFFEAKQDRFIVGGKCGKY